MTIEEYLKILPKTIRRVTNNIEGLGRTFPYDFHIKINESYFAVGYIGRQGIKCFYEEYMNEKETIVNALERLLVRLLNEGIIDSDYKEIPDKRIPRTDWNLKDNIFIR